MLKPTPGAKPLAPAPPDSPVVRSRRGCRDDLLLDLGGAAENRPGAAEPPELAIVAESSGGMLAPVTAGPILAARAAAVAPGALGGDHPPGDPLAPRRLPRPPPAPHHQAPPPAPGFPHFRARLAPRQPLP